MKINVKNDTMGEHYARIYADRIGNISSIIFRSNKNIILELSENMEYLSHKIIDHAITIKADDKKRSKRTKTFSKETLDVHPKAQHILKLVKEHKHKCRAIKLIANVGDVFIKRVFAVYNIEALPHQIPKFRT